MLLREVPRGDLSPLARHTLVTLLDFADPDGSNCFPTYEGLAEVMGRGRSQVGEGLAELVKNGWIEREPFARGGHRRTRYVFLIPVAGGQATSGPPDDHSPAHRTGPVHDLSIREEGPCLVDSLVDLVVGVNELEAKRVKRSPEVAEHARRAAAKGYGKADVVAAWSEQPPKVIHGGPDLAVALLDRLGTRLPPTRQRSGRRRRGCSIAPSPASTFDEYEGSGMRSW